MSDIILKKSNDIRPECNFCFKNDNIFNIRGKGFLQVAICDNCLNELYKQANNVVTGKKQYNLPIVSVPKGTVSSECNGENGFQYNQDPKNCKLCPKCKGSGQNEH